MDYTVTDENAFALETEATAITALLRAALRQWDVSPYETKPQECAFQLVNAITGVLMLAEQHEKTAETTFSI